MRVSVKVFEVFLKSQSAYCARVVLAGIRMACQEIPHNHHCMEFSMRVLSMHKSYPQGDDICIQNLSHFNLSQIAKVLIGSNRQTHQ